MQRTRSISLTIGVILAIAASSVLVSQTDLALFGASESEDDEQVAHGEIMSVDLHRNSFVMQVEDRDEEITIRVDERTQYMLNGEEATRDETLIEGHLAQVTHRNKLATQVDATSPTGRQ